VTSSVRLPDPILELVPGELVHYRRWCPARTDWITDGIPLLVVDVLEGGIATVLTEQGTVNVPMTLLKRPDMPFSFFASII